MMDSKSSLRTSRVYLNNLFRSFVIALMIGLVVIYVLSDLFNFGNALFEPGWVILLFVELVLLAIILSWHQVSLDDDTLVIRWSPFYVRKIALADLALMEKTTLSTWRYGLGMRFIGDRTLALIHGKGPAVKLWFKGNRNYLITLNDDQPTRELVETISKISDKKI